MLKKLCFSLLIVASLASCKSNSTSAFDYSQSLAKKETDITVDITKTESKVGDYFKAEQYDSIGVAGAKMEKIVDDKIAEIKAEKTPDVKEATNFKEAFIKYFSFIKSMYTAYKEYGNCKTQEERDAKMVELQAIVAKKNEVSSEIQAAQQKFADANGFQIDKSK